MAYVPQLFSLTGKTIVLTGAGGFLVGELSRALARAGAHVVVCDVRLHKAEAVASEISRDGGSAVALELDVRVRDQIEAVLARTIERFGQADGLLNGAGINAPTSFLDITVAEWDDILAVNLTGTMLACQVFGRHMLERDSGSIVNISSASSGPPLSKAFAYSAAKAGVANLTQNLAREWGDAGVRVNALRPGFFPTDWSKKNFITPEREAAIFNHTPMRRYGKPDELVGAAVWLFSDASSFVTGAEIAVDGGFTAMTI
jgi:NAD(P)-dependent dehydrogenase (short-subunit alcohol dehydrogenase family)